MDDRLETKPTLALFWNYERIKSGPGVVRIGA
jgi:hypothetical protein